MAVVVQRQLRPQASGVMFTRDPVTSAKKFVVEAALGLGEGVVTGEAPADHLELDPSTGQELASFVASKDTALALRDGGGVRKT